MKAEKGSRRSWSQQDETVFISALKELVATGWKSDNGFRGGYLARLDDAMKKEFPTTDLKGIPHINSKIASWKNNYYLLTLMLKRSGVGFNGNGTHVIDCTDDQWDQIKKCDSNARTMRYKAWPMYEDWKELFGKDRTTGDSAEDVIDMVNGLMSQDNQTQEGKEDGDYNRIDDTFFAVDVEENSVCSEKGAPSMKTTGKGKKRKVVADVAPIVDIFREITSGTNVRLQQICSRIGYEYDLDEAKNESFALLQNIAGLSREEKFAVCHIFLDKPDRLLIFKGLSNDDKPHYVQYILKGKSI